MKITDIMKKRTSFSFEVFPPKNDQPVEPLLTALDEMYKFSPDFISCTYGAEGTNAGRQVEILESVVAHGKTAVAHFTCIGNTKEKIKVQLDEYLAKGVNHILALRGDFPAGQEQTGGDFDYANELVDFIRREYGDKFTIAVGGDPEKHIQCPTFMEDIAHLKMKCDAGADVIMTQLCWDMDGFFRWVDQIRKAKIDLPIDVGVMPVLNKEACMKMAFSMNGCSIPRDMAELISRYYNDPAGFREAGIEYTIGQIYRFIGEGMDGIHLYSLNKSEAVSKVLNGSGLRRSK